MVKSRTTSTKKKKTIGTRLATALGALGLVMLAAPAPTSADEVDSLTDVMKEMAALIRKESDCDKKADSLLKYIDSSEGKLERLGKKTREKDLAGKITAKQQKAFDEAVTALDGAVDRCDAGKEVVAYARTIFNSGRSSAVRPLSKREKEELAAKEARKAAEEKAAREKAEREAAERAAREAEEQAKEAAERKAAEEKAAAEQAAAEKAAAEKAAEEKAAEEKAAEEKAEAPAEAPTETP